MIRYFLIGAAFCLVNCGGGEKRIDQLNEFKSEPSRSTPVPNELPELLITLEDGSTKSTRELKGKTVLVLFQPDCDHCQRQAVDFEQHISAFDDFQLYFISSATIKEVLKFAEDYKLRNYKNIHWGTTTVTNILSSFGPIEAPSIYVYKGEGQLIQSFIGEAPVENIMEAIQHSLDSAR